MATGAVPASLGSYLDGELLRAHLLSSSWLCVSTTGWLDGAMVVLHKAKNVPLYCLGSKSSANVPKLL